MRHDHTSWLIHFVRDRLPEQDFSMIAEEGFECAEGAELESDADAFTVLKTIIRLGGLYPGYSFRSGKTTIYGGKPAICATEMPLYSFASYVKDRNDSGSVSAYGIAFLKSEFFSSGGRPVIYGLSGESSRYVRNDLHCRILDNSVLPKSEQYRYVAYSPSGNKWIDWSHEREWRWKADEKSEIISSMTSDYCGDGMPGLPLFHGEEEGGYFSKLGIIVWTEQEAQEIRALITGFYFAQTNDYSTPFSRKVIENSFIIVLENVVSQVEVDGNLNSQTIEGLERSELLSPIIILKPPHNAGEIITKALDKANRAGMEAADKYIKSHNTMGNYCGFAYAVTYEITNPLVQYMLNQGVASGPYDGCIHINVRGDWPHSPSMDYREQIYMAVAKVLQEELGFPIYMNSRPD